jgi:ubiquinone biosynthesis protein COQ9
MRIRNTAEEYMEVDKNVSTLIHNAKRKFEKKLSNGDNRRFFAYLIRKVDLQLPSTEH